MTSFDPDLVALAQQSPAWPFEEARKLLARVQKTQQTRVLFETGYGPSGLPHIGTFGEVARTSMVRTAFRLLTQDRIETHLIAFSDDMDGLRKVPENIPNRDMLIPYIGRPLTQVPDPFGQYESFAHHNNARLRAFLDHFGFSYEFASSTQYYTSGRFDDTLLYMLAKFEDIQKIMLPSLREERAATYSPFLPLHPKTGVVMQVPVEKIDVKAGTLFWRDPMTKEGFETKVTGGACKLQWKPDWAMRWAALGVDYEMAGKDLIDSMKLSSAITRVLGALPPEGFHYELFLDAEGQKISKSRGNGLEIDEWLTYASPESLALFMFQRPKEAKRLHFEVIPRCVDEYLQFLEAYPRQDGKGRLGNPVWHVHEGHPPAPEVLSHGTASTSISFGMLLNLAAVANSEDPHVLWGFLQRYAPQASPATHPRLQALVQSAVTYFKDFVRPQKAYRTPDAQEEEALRTLDEMLADLPPDSSPEAIQTALYDIGRSLPRYQDFKAKGASPEKPGVSNQFFSMLYQILMGEERGPRFGSFIALYGIPQTRKLISHALSGELIRRHANFLTALPPKDRGDRSLPQER